MRKRVWALAAALLMLPLTGCGSLLNRDYSVTEPHSSSYYESEDRSVLRAESYQDLVNALLVLISGGAKEGTIWLYPDDSGLSAPQAAERACLEVQKETPLGAYAVEYLTYTVDETPRNYDAIQLTVGYRRTAAQVAGIVHITSTSALGDLLREAARNHAAELVVQVGYFDHQAEEVRTQVRQIQAEVEPESKEPWTVNFYPDSGNAGIIEVLLSGAGSAEGAEQNTEKVMLLVPEQYSFESEKAMLKLLGPRDLLGRGSEARSLSFAPKNTPIRQDAGIRGMRRSTGELAA